MSQLSLQTDLSLRLANALHSCRTQGEELELRMPITKSQFTQLLQEFASGWVPSQCSLHYFANNFRVKKSGKTLQCIQKKTIYQYTSTVYRISVASEETFSDAPVLQWFREKPKSFVEQLRQSAIKVNAHSPVTDDVFFRQHLADIQWTMASKKQGWVVNQPCKIGEQLLPFAAASLTIAPAGQVEIPRQTRRRKRWTLTKPLVKIELSEWVTDQTYKAGVTVHYSVELECLQLTKEAINALEKTFLAITKFLKE